MIFYGFNLSADGYVMDAEGNFDWSAPDEELHEYWNQAQRETVLNVYGRKLWETMSYWRAPPPDSAPVERAFAEAWQATPTIVVSRTLRRVDGAELVRDVSEVPDRDGPVQVGGPTLAAAMFDRIDEFRAILYPTAVGGGTPFFPAGVRLRLKLVETRPFESGAVLLRYQRA
ncbi:dihydrofolate reductase family protein [Solirubrobacter deserti]|uniref:Dihydrofolate reductase family protein n=1 Tax=Solirubrobacter deserti TaxID=2282478 RepID=A0ABT4RGE5_9ACTN|nr:dihydrofolate reductase family protein [Solirubrobacter deserti]MDA0137594.1 dihydrofolate reductase family protein [Solirubrobacter deserti]